MAQKASLFAHLQRGETITQLEARHVYGIERLASRIEELRRDGHDIVSTEKTDAKGKRYVQYSLVLRDRNGKRKAV
jgi:hypothetical protein